MYVLNIHHLVLFSLQTPLSSYTPVPAVSLAGIADILSRLYKEHASPLSFCHHFPQKSVKKCLYKDQVSELKNKS